MAALRFSAEGSAFTAQAIAYTALFALVPLSLVAVAMLAFIFGTDEGIARANEAIQVYGPALKELIHEEWGDGIMSAINFEVDISRRENEDGEDRVRIVMDGKFLPYKW